MSSNPIDPEFLHLAREWAGSAMSPENLRPIPGGAIAAARIILDLPEPAPLTMDKITWSDAEHHLAEAEHENGLKVVMLAPIRSEYGEVVAISCDMDGEHVDYHPDNLTPNGNRHKLVPAEWEGGPFPDRQPGTTEPDAEQGSNSLGKLKSSEPQPGEAWLVAYSHVPNETFNVIFDHGGHSYDSQGSVWGLDEVTPLHRLSPVVEPRVLNGYSHYNGAKLGTVVEECASENAWVKSHHDYWRLIGIDSFGVEGRISGDMAGTSRTVIWEPGEQA